MSTEQKKIAYLFGAGATHAEITRLGTFDADADGLLIGNVTKRVLLKAKKNKSFLKDYQFFLERVADRSNIELFISFVEDNAYAINDASKAVGNIKRWVEEDIKHVLAPDRIDKFILHKALLELHKHNNKEEAICGLISLNYDTVLDDAYKSLYEEEPNYFLSSVPKDRKGPSLLKLHGSFDWEVPIIPLGINKNYLRLPYNFIWGRALEILAECDILRIVGCSLSSHDIHLVDLLFKAHLKKQGEFEIQLICSDIVGETIKSNYSFFPKIKTAMQIEEPLLPEAEESTNVFEEWLKAKGKKVLKDDSVIGKTIYLKQIIL